MSGVLGSWVVNAGDHCGARIDGSDGRSVAHATQRDPHPTLGQGITQAEAMAHARLIATAPEMFAELQDILRSITDGGNVVTFGEADIARYEALIAKALS